MAKYGVLYEGRECMKMYEHYKERRVKYKRKKEKKERTPNHGRVHAGYSEMPLSRLSSLLSW